MVDFGSNVKINTRHMQDCPFCDDFGGIYTDWEDRIGNYHYVGCYGCNIRGPSCLDRDMQKAADGSILNWNVWALMVKVTEVKLDSFE